MDLLADLSVHSHPLFLLLVSRGLEKPFRGLFRWEEGGPVRSHEKNTGVYDHVLASRRPLACASGILFQNTSGPQERHWVSGDLG